MPSKIAYRSIFVAAMLWLSADPTGAAQKVGDPLEPGKTIERDLAGGEAHSYLIKLDSGQFLNAVIEQRRTDLTAALFGPDGRQVGQFDGLWYGTEPVCYVAEATGSYRLEIRTLNQAAPRGSYQLKLEEPRAPAAQDKKRVAAVRASTEGKRLIEKGDAQSFNLAKEKYEEALPEWREVGDRFAEAVTLDSLGFLHWRLGASDKAIEYYNQALTIRQDIKDQDGEGETLNNMAAAYSTLGKKEQALEFYKLALPLRRSDGDRAATLGNMGIIHLALGDPRKAIEHYDQALPLWRAAGAGAGEVSALVNLGSIHRILGESQLALDYLHRGAQIARESNDRRGEAYALLFLSRIHIDLGEYEKALDFCGRALPLFRFIGDHSGEAMALNFQGQISSFWGAKQKALDFYSQALSSFRSVNDSYNGATTLLNIGKVNEESGQRQAALDYYNQALKLFRDFKNRRGEALALNYLGSLYASLGEKQKGLECHRQALPLWRAVGDRGSEAATLANLARIQLDMSLDMGSGANRDPGNLVEARHNIEATIAITESLRVKIASQQLRDSYFGATRQYHELYIDILMRLHRLQPSEGHNVSALSASERARARGLLEMLAEARADVSEGIAPSLLERERSLQKRINASA
ncbi:MAG TPA: tetratricopeptide repeat protein [Blastocatellia bacterium]